MKEDNMISQLFSKIFTIIVLGSTYSTFLSGQCQAPPSELDDGYYRANDYQAAQIERRREIADRNLPKAPYGRDENFRMGDWDFHENWRYNRDAFYRGESQPEAYREEHPYGPGGIGYDADVNYRRNLRRYQELYEKSPTPENRERLNELINPYHVRPYHGNYGEGSRNDYDRR